MVDNKRRVVGATSYKRRAPERMGVILPAEVPPDERSIYYKRHLLAEVRELVELIRLDREDLIAELHERQEERLLTGEELVFPDIFAIIGRKLFQQWQAEGIELEHCWLMEGQCGPFAHTWFRLEMSADLVGEPQWFYTVDPYARDLSLLHMGCPSPPESDFLGIQPWSPFHTLYTGEKVDRLWEEDEPAPSGEGEKEEGRSGSEAQGDG